MIKFIARQKFYFDLGSSFFALLQFTFVVIAANDKIASKTNCSATTVICITVPAAFMIIWSIGYAMDKLKYAQAYYREQNTRNNELLKALKQ